MAFKTAQQLGLGNIGLGSSGQAAVRQAASTLNYGASYPGTAAVSSPTSGGSATKLSLAGQTGYQPPSQNLPSFSVNQQGTVTSPPPAPRATDSSGILHNEQITPPAWAAYTEPSHPPFTDESGGDTEFGKLLKLMRNDPNHPYNIRRYAELMAEWQAAHPQPTMPAPTPAPPPVMPQVAITQPKPVGATAALPSVSPTTGAGVSGQAFPALTQQAGALKGIQNISSLPLSLGPAQLPASAKMIPQLPTGQSPEQLNTLLRSDAMQRALQTQTPQEAQSLTRKLFGRDIEQSIGPAFQAASLVTGAKGLGEAGYGIGKALLKGGLSEGMDLGAALRKGIGNIFSGLAVPLATDTGPFPTAPETKAAIDATNLRRERTITKPTLDSGGLRMQPETVPEKKYGAMSQILPPEQHGQVIQMFTSGQIPKEQAVAAIASPEAKITIGKMINQAVKAGDMYSVAKLAELPPAIDQNIKFVQMIGRVVLATAGGFGTPNAPGVTEARMPMVEMGTAQALTTPPTFAQATPAGQTGVQRRPWTPPYFQPEVQTQRPVINPYMG